MFIHLHYNKKLGKKQNHKFYLKKVFRHMNNLTHKIHLPYKNFNNLNSLHIELRTTIRRLEGTKINYNKYDGIYKKLFKNHTKTT